MTERMRLNHLGNVSINSLSTGITAPTTSGTTKVVVSDANGLLSNIPISSLPNFANMDLRFTGNRTQSAAGNFLTIDSMDYLIQQVRGMALTLLKRDVIINAYGSISKDLDDHAQFGDVYYKTNGTVDSIHQRLRINGVTGIHVEYTNTSLSRIARLSLYKQHAQLRADSVMISAIPASTADSVLATGGFDAATQTRTVLAVPMLKSLKGSTTWAPGSVAAGSSATTTITVTGAVSGDPVTVSKATGGYSNGEIYDAFVSAPDTVTIRVHNVSTGGATYGSTETYKVIVLKY